MRGGLIVNTPKLKVKMPLIDDDGFIVGRTWESNGRDTVMINKANIKRIDVNCGFNPPVHRLHFIDGTPYLNLMAEMPDE